MSIASANVLVRQAKRQTDGRCQAQRRLGTKQQQQQQQKGSKAAADSAAVYQQQQCKNRDRDMNEHAGPLILSEAYLHGNNCSLHLPVGMLSQDKLSQAEPPQEWKPHLLVPHTNLHNISWASATGTGFLFRAQDKTNLFVVHKS